MKKALVILFSLVTLNVSAEEIRLTLDDAIARARVHSVHAAAAVNELKSAYWAYRSYRAELLPEISFNASLPSYQRAYSTYMNDQGSFSFVKTNYMQLNGTLSINQNVWLTGGTIGIQTSLDFLRQFEGATYNRYMSVPIAITLNQPLFGVNNVKWDRKIEPVRYEEAKARFLSQTEEVAMSCITYYFSLLLARENLAIARQNLANAEKLYTVAMEKRRMGKISENDLLQMELNLLNAQSDLTSCQSNARSAMFQLRSFLDYADDIEIEPVIPTDIPNVDVTYSDALERALANNRFVKKIRRQQLEADYAVAKAKGNQRQINLFARIGLTGASTDVGDAYNHLKANQAVEVGFSIPLVDWGRRRGQVKVAESQRALVESQSRQEISDFNQDLFILVERFCSQQSQVAIAAKSDDIAEKRYQTNVETFLIGKISTLDLNDSQVKKDEKRREYVNQLYAYWSYYYQLRSLTLWDYADNTGIDADISKIIRQ